jgi:hypothetical protein
MQRRLRRAENMTEPPALRLRLQPNGIGNLDFEADTNLTRATAKIAGRSRSAVKRAVKKVGNSRRRFERRLVG